MKNIYALLLLSLILTSCSGEDSIDSSAITHYQWKLTAFKTSQPVDLNRDGIASTDMTLEFDCVSNEGFGFNQPNNGSFSFTDSPLLGHGNSDNSIYEYVCDENITQGFSYFGSYKMVSENTIQFHFNELIGGYFPFEPYNLRYELVGDKLIQTREQSYPTTYSTANTRWINSTITITKEYSRVSW